MIKNISKFIQRFEEALNSNILKGLESHLKMSPKIEELPYRSFTPSEKSKKSSVLLLLVGNDFDGLKILFTLRSSNVQHHKNQLSFPGGHCEESENIINTALREAEEEIGIEPSRIKILGKLTPLYVPPSETVVYPVVGYSEKVDFFKINRDEVEEVILKDLNFFLDDSTKIVERWQWNKEFIDVPLWRIHPSVPLWGATAMIMSEFIDIAKEIIIEENYG